ncbi:hypothetical protein [Algoriphagus persicinus]|uniref:hypothetical protein n=1 Tax=Algoriphagus persicinus TaxID=3108754 RepID=UPI002B3DD13C|nr:hypothetical protein [Algoriphagus sp. E1-3-M2]MEB2783576.1 hypothetical protein [Algoriphagus sp. E1-3-M2]
MIRLIFSLGCMLAYILASVSSIAQSSPDTIQRKNFSELTALFELAKPTDSIAGVYLTELISLSEKQGEYDLMAKYVLRFTHHPSSSNQTLELTRLVLKRTIAYEDELSKSQDIGNLHLKLAGNYFNLEQFAA